MPLSLVASAPADAPIVLRGHRGAVTAAAFTDDGRWLVTADTRGVVHAWPLRDPTRPLTLLDGPPAHVTGLAPLGEDAIAFVAGDTIRCVRLGSGSPTPVPGWDRAVRFDDGARSVIPADRFVAAGRSGELVVRDGTAARRLRVEGGITAIAREPAPSLEIHGEGVIAIGDEAGFVTLVDAKRHTVRTRFRAAPGPIAGLTIFQPLLRPPMIVTSCFEEPFVRTWHADRPAGESQHRAAAVAFSPDGTWLALGDRDDVLVTEPRAGRVAAKLRGHEGPVHTIAYSPLTITDWRGTLATGGADGTVRLWPLHPSGVHFAEFEADSRPARRRTQLASAYDGRSKASLSRHLDDAHGTYLLADGLGSMHGASAVADLVEAIGRDEPWPLLQADEWLEWVLRDVNARVFARQHPTGLRTGACVAVLMVEGFEALAVHVGNVLVYRVRGGEARRIGRAHTILEDAIDMAGVPSSEAERLRTTDDLRWKVLRAVGVEGAVRPTFTRFDVAVGDRLVLASSAVASMVGPERLGAIVAAASSAGEAARLLVDAAAATAPEPPGAIVLDVTSD